MNPAPPIPQPGSIARAPATPAGFPWSRGLIAGALALTLLQAGVFVWLVRIPGAARVTPGNQRTGETTIDPTSVTLLAIDGLREEAGWLPNPRQFLNRQPGGGNRRTSPPVPIELATPSRSGPGQFLAAAAAPPPAAPAIPRPEFRPPAMDPPRPSSPATQSLALADPQLTITGGLRDRALLRPIILPSWTGPESLGITRVEVSVNVDGEVVLARVVESSGVKAADQLFLAACRTSRFVAAGKLPAGQEFNELARGRISLRWPAPPAP